MSYYGVPMSTYRRPDAGTPGWNLAPVPGWGVNPLQSGPPRVGVGLEDAILEEDGYEGDKYNQYTIGHVAFAGAAGIAFGMLLMWIWRETIEKRK